MGLSPSIEGFGGVPPSLGEVGVTHQQLFTCSFCYTFFVVHYVSRLNHGSDYYSSNYSGIFWPVISVISISGSFSDRVSSKPWCVVPPPPLMPRSSGGVFGSISVPQQQIPSSMPPLAYANYAMGSPQVGFFLFSELSLPPFCILYMFGVCSGVCFLF